MILRPLKFSHFPRLKIVIIFISSSFIVSGCGGSGAVQMDSGPNLSAAIIEQALQSADERLGEKNQTDALKGSDLSSELTVHLVEDFTFDSSKISSGNDQENIAAIETGNALIFQGIEGSQLALSRLALDDRAPARRVDILQVHALNFSALSETAQPNSAFAWGEFALSALSAAIVFDVDRFILKKGEILKTYGRDLYVIANAIQIDGTIDTTPIENIPNRPGARAGNITLISTNDVKLWNAQLNTKGADAGEIKTSDAAHLPPELTATIASAYQPQLSSYGMSTMRFYRRTSQPIQHFDDVDRNQELPPEEIAGEDLALAVNSINFWIKNDSLMSEIKQWLDSTFEKNVPGYQDAWNGAVSSKQKGVNRALTGGEVSALRKEIQYKFTESLLKLYSQKASVCSDLQLNEDSPLGLRKNAGELSGLGLHVGSHPYLLFSNDGAWVIAKATIQVEVDSYVDRFGHDLSRLSLGLSKAGANEADRDLNAEQLLRELHVSSPEIFSEEMQKEDYFGIQPLPGGSGGTISIFRATGKSIGHRFYDSGRDSNPKCFGLKAAPEESLEKGSLRFKRRSQVRFHLDLTKNRSEDPNSSHQDFLSSPSSSKSDLAGDLVVNYLINWNKEKSCKSKNWTPLSTAQNAGSSKAGHIAPTDGYEADYSNVERALHAIDFKGKADRTIWLKRAADAATKRK